MKNIGYFANAPDHSSDGHFRNNTVVAPEIIKYLEDESDVRPFFVSKPMRGVLSKSFRIAKDEGIAVQIAGNAEVPRAEDVEKMFTIFLHRNATGWKVDDDDKKINRDDPQYLTRKMTRAMERLYKKERLDMKNVFIAAPQNTMSYTGTLTVDDVKNAVVTMVTQTVGYGMDDIQPDIIFMSYKTFRELQLDPNFKYVPEIFQRLLVEGKISAGASRSSLSGPTGQMVDGLDIHLMNELDTDIILLDSTKEALWLAEDQEPTITRYRDDEHISDITDIRHDEQPVCVRPECLFKITKA